MVKIIEINGLKQSSIRTISKAYQLIKNILEIGLNISIFSEA
jgi:hypothetical protein